MRSHQPNEPAARTRKNVVIGSSAERVCTSMKNAREWSHFGHLAVE